MSKQKGRIEFIAFAALAFLLAVYFAKPIFFGEVFSCCDNLLINVPAKTFLVNEMKEGRLPLWNPYIFSGTPFLADINMSVFHPFNIFFFLASPFRAVTWAIIVGYLVALWGMYRLARLLGVSAAGAILSAIAFGFSGTMAMYTDDLPLVQAASLVPWVVWGWVRLAEKFSGSRLTILVLASSLQLISGYPQIAYLTHIFGGSYFLFFGAASWFGKAKRIGEVAILVILLSGAQVVPFVEFVFHSSRLGADLAFASVDSLHPRALLRLLVPSVTGYLSGKTAWYQGGITFGYVGIIVSLLAIFAPWRARKTHFLAVSALLSLLFSLGTYTPIYTVAFSLIPGVSLIRPPQHFLLWFTLALPLLAGRGLDQINKNNGRVRRIFGAAALMLLIIFLGVKNGADDWLNIADITREVARNLFGAGLLVAACWWGIQVNKRHGIFGRLIIISAVFLEIYLFGRGSLITSPLEKVNTWIRSSLPITEQIERSDWKDFRFLADQSLIPRPGKVAGIIDLDASSSWQAETLRPNMSFLFSLPTIDGYASMIYTPYQEEVSRSSNDPTLLKLERPKLDFLNKFSVRYVLAAKGESHYQNLEGVEQKLTQNNVTLYQNNKALPRWYALIDNQSIPGGVKPVLVTPSRLVFETHLDSPSRVVLADTDYPGWVGFVDGRKTKIERYEKILKSVVVPAGSHRIEFVFQPGSFSVGVVLTLLGVLLLFLVNRRMSVTAGEKKN